MIASAPSHDRHVGLHAARAWRDRARIEWFDVGRYGANALPIGVGGRGGAWYLEGPFGAAVLRHYRRGGLAAKLSDEHYLWLGRDRARCVREIDLLDALVDAGLPVPEPIAGAWWRDGPFYRAALLMRRIAVRGDLMSLMHDNTAEAPWAAVGRTIAQFHRFGAHHPDLNARNILQGHDGTIVVIDWDRGSAGHRPGRWCDDELQRLERSLVKYRRQVTEQAVAVGMRVLRGAYGEAMATGSEAAR